MGASRPADVVVLAAGRSSRMGEPKGLVRVDGRPWIEHQLEAIAAALGEAGARVVIVLGDDRERYAEAVPDLPRRATVVVNPAPERGPFSSLQVGLAAPPAGGLPGAVFVLPVDVPAASPPVWEALAAALEGEAAVAVPELEGRGGHPVLLAPSFVSHLRALPPSARLDEAIRGLPAASRRAVPVADPRVRLNLNAPEDWGRVRGGG